MIKVASGEFPRPFAEKLAALSGSSEALPALKLWAGMPSLRVKKFWRELSSGGPLCFLISYSVAASFYAILLVKSLSLSNSSIVG